MNTETPRPSIDQAVDGIEKLLKLAHDDLSLSFLNFWHGNKLEDKIKSILREYAQKENQELIKWKKEQMAVWLPLLEYFQHEDKDIKIGKSISAEALMRSKEYAKFKEQVEHLTAEKDELVINLEACEKERLEAVRKVVERDGLIRELCGLLNEIHVYDYNHLVEHRVSALTAEISNKIKAAIKRIQNP